MLSLLPERLDEMVLLGAHCDDIAIGAGAALLELCRANPGVRVNALVFTGGRGRREEEERAALAAFCPGAKLELTVLELRDTRLPIPQWDLAKDVMQGLRQVSDPDLVFAPAPHDAHQDHRAVAELVPTAFRDHLTLGYEILKWEGDLMQPQAYLPLTQETLHEKIALLIEHYGSQHRHPWFDREAFAGLARIRGVQCHTRYAEAFHLSKLVIGSGLAAPGTGSAGDSESQVA
jgi:LmbE family N-acetylglucosaminyl deacetylase